MGTLYYIDDMTNHRRFELGKGGWEEPHGGRNIAEVLERAPGQIHDALERCWCVHTLHQHDPDYCASYRLRLADVLLAFRREGAKLVLHNDGEHDEGPWNDWPDAGSRYL